MRNGSDPDFVIQKAAGMQEKGAGQWKEKKEELKVGSATQKAPKAAVRSLLSPTASGALPAQALPEEVR